MDGAAHDHADALATAARRLRAGDHIEARRQYRRLLALAPGDWRALQGDGIAAYSEGRLDTALAALNRARAVQPDRQQILSNRAVVFGAAGFHDEALRNIEGALSVSPNTPELHYNRGNALQRLHRFEEAVEAFRRAHRMRPDQVETGWNLGLALLRLGRYREGWPYYEWRWRRPGAPVERHNIPAWGGEAFDGRTLLLYSEQGLGDALQFIRFLPLVRQRGSDIVIECQPELIRLLASQPDAPRLVARKAPLPDVALQAAIASLPAIFGIALADIPANVPYLRAPDGPKPSIPDHGLRVGLVWATVNDPSRSCPLDALLPLTGIPNVSVLSLQRNSASAGLAQVGAPILDMAPFIDDMADTARIIAELDLVITVDTSVAHLAGALGRPTWLLLPHLADWRWLTDRDDSPWYPTMRLFRQRVRGDWSEVVSRVRTALEQLAAPIVP